MYSCNQGRAEINIPVNGPESQSFVVVVVVVVVFHSLCKIIVAYTTTTKTENQIMEKHTF